MTIFIPLISTKTPFILEGVLASEVMNIVPKAKKFIESCHVIEEALNLSKNYVEEKLEYAE